MKRKKIIITKFVNLVFDTKSGRVPVKFIVET